MNTAETTVTLAAGDAIELAAALGWLRDWFASDPDTLAASMRRHSFGLFRLDDVDSDLAHYAWLLGGDE